MDASKSLSMIYNDFTLFSALPVLFNMYTDKDSNLISNDSYSRSPSIHSKEGELVKNMIKQEVQGSCI